MWWWSWWWYSGEDYDYVKLYGNEANDGGEDYNDVRLYVDEADEGMAVKIMTMSNCMVY